MGQWIFYLGIVAAFATLGVLAYGIGGFGSSPVIPIADIPEGLDWNFWHDYVHNNLIRDSFIAIADVLATVADPEGVDGIVNGVGRTIRGVSGQLRKIQTGNVGNYALSLFIGVTALVVYFIFAG